MKKMIFLCEAVPGTTWFEQFDDAEKALAAWERQTRHDRNRRTYAAIVAAETDADGDVDYETIDELQILQAGRGDW